MIASYNDLGQTVTFLRDSLRALIAIIPKEGKDPTTCSSYRPISLLNTDLKRFAKILATCLAQHLQTLIHQDQVGFIPTREARDSTTKALNLIHIANQTHTPSLFVNTDAEKVFDRIHWQYMFVVVRHIGLGETMIKWITQIYSTPTAQVKTNGILSDPFQIANGTR